MIVDSMTHAEAYRELEADRENVQRWFRRKTIAYRRQALKATKFPLVWWTEYTSPRYQGNRQHHIHQMRHPRRGASFCLVSLGLVIARRLCNHKHQIRMKRLQVFFTTAALAALLLCLAGCKAKERVVMVETVRVDTTYITQQQRDSIYVHDSVYVSEQQTGDTITRIISKWSVKYRDRAVHDTIYKVRTDSVPYHVEVTEFVPAPLTWWQQTRLHLANIVLYALAIFVAVWAARLWMRR